MKDFELSIQTHDERASKIAKVPFAKQNAKENGWFNLR